MLFGYIQDKLTKLYLFTKLAINLSCVFLGQKLNDPPLISTIFLTLHESTGQLYHISITI